MSSALNYYNSSQSLKDCAYWIAFLRLYAYVRTPACIYSNVITESSHQIYLQTRSIAVPDYITNILVELNNVVDAREAAILGCDSHLESEKISVYDDCVDPMLRDLFFEDGVIPDRYRKISSTFKPRRVGLYELSRSSVVRLGSELVAVVEDELKCKGAHEAIARCVAHAARGIVPVAPLWLDEIQWVERHLPYAGPMCEVRTSIV